MSCVFCPTTELAAELADGTPGAARPEVRLPSSRDRSCEQTERGGARLRGRYATLRSWSRTPRPRKAATSSSPTSWYTSACRRRRTASSSASAAVTGGRPKAPTAAVAVVPGPRATGTDSYAGAWERILARRASASSTPPSRASSRPSTTQPTRRGGFCWNEGLEAPTRRDPVREMLDAEIERVREQDALDSLETSADERSVYARIVEVESEADELRRPDRQPCFPRTGALATSDSSRSATRGRRGRLRGRSAACPASKPRSR